MSNRLSRRRFFGLAGGTMAAAAGAALLPNVMGSNVLTPQEIISWACGGANFQWFESANAATAQELRAPDMVFAGTDGWIWLPPDTIPPFHPDDLAPQPFNTYMFGFRNVTGLDTTQLLNQKMKAQHNAPLFWLNEGAEFHLQLTNLGLALRPDLVDAHTVHWHGFRNVIPFFDGEPMGSLSVPIGRNFTYVYVPKHPGTYMFHCHVEDIEHVHMGMTGLVFIRPAQNGDTSFYPSGKYAYNDADGSTGYDREFAMFLSEVWTESHWCDSHIQLPMWSDYKVDFALLNGRVYPDTLAPNNPLNTMTGEEKFLPFQTDAVGDLVPNTGLERLQYQPHSSLVTCNAGERVLLRFANLGFTQAAMTTSGLRMRVVGKDATLLAGRTGVGSQYMTSTISLGAGESADIIIDAPAFTGGNGSSGLGYDVYLLYNRSYGHVSNHNIGDYRGQMTEIRVYPAGGISAQILPNT